MVDIVTDLPVRTDIASDDYLVWTNTGDGLSGDRYLTSVATLAAAIGTAAGVTSGTVGFATGKGGAVTQITNAGTGVTLSKLCGQITTVALTTAAAAEEVFIVTNTLVDANDVIALSTTYAGGGTPILWVKAVGAGVFTIVVTNVHASAALDALMVINFAVIKSVVA